MSSFKPGDKSTKEKSSGEIDKRVKIGREYEQLAAKFYKDNGFIILESNWQASHREIDLIVQKDKLIVFVEVKSTSSKKYGHPAERVDKRKQENLIKAAQKYLQEKEITDYDLRFDVVTFVNGIIEHYPNAFGVE
ncbi:MAG: YraN family protein [bacterium]